MALSACLPCNGWSIVTGVSAGADALFVRPDESVGSGLVLMTLAGRALAMTLTCAEVASAGVAVVEVAVAEAITAMAVTTQPPSVITRTNRPIRTIMH